MLTSDCLMWVKEFNYRVPILCWCNFGNFQEKTSCFTDVFSNWISYIKGSIMLSKNVERMCNESAIGYHHNEMHFEICSEKPQEPQYNWIGLKTLISWIWYTNPSHYHNFQSPNTDSVVMGDDSQPFLHASTGHFTCRPKDFALV